jgi:ubiquitin carboxyl-terminal hydrolase 22/27/51
MHAFASPALLLLAPNHTAPQRMNDLTLAGCLRRFVRPECLGPAAHWRCSACGSTAEALKQMSVRRLPHVLCFHIKRFEHGGAAQRPRKLDVPLHFPLHRLDMEPFTTSAVLRSAAQLAGHASGAVGSGGDAGVAGAAAAGDGSGGGADQHAPSSSFQAQCMYELFGVVSHWGDMSSGHYVSYVKCEGFWYLVNDPWVVPVSEADVAGVQAYMLFYQRCSG